jgi:hypothetical protein
MCITAVPLGLLTYNSKQKSGFYHRHLGAYVDICNGNKWYSNIKGERRHLS